MIKKFSKRFYHKLSIFFEMILPLKKLSHDPKHQVVSAIIPDDFSGIRAVGYNGNASGLDHERDSIEHGESGFLHAEENALMKAGLHQVDASKYIMINTLAPCYMCAKRILNNNLETVFYLEEYKSDTRGVELLRSQGVHCEQISVEDFEKYQNLNK
jgi:dCMP deaminase